ncbi:MAG: hypothetical protein AAGG75_22335 [Bacteroidota bacterium]
MKRIMLLVWALWAIIPTGNAQVYVEKQTRHRFAQLNLGLGHQFSIGGQTRYLNTDGGLTPLDFNSFHSPRLLIGGTHFWGHADFYIAIPLVNPDFTSANQEVTALTGVETVFKYYPWRIQHQRIAPYLGLSLAPFYYEQKNGNLDFGNGPELNRTTLPLLAGLTYNYNNHLVELGLMWNYNNDHTYYIAREVPVEVELPPIYFNISYRYMIETTLSAERGWESGRTKEVTQKMEAAKRLNAFYFGGGLSSAFWIKESNYNTNTRPYLERLSTSIMPDFTIGYYLHKPDMNIALSYRGYGSSTNGYGAVQQFKRRSLVLEATKVLFDYHGFVPFLGPAISYERLSFEESFEGQRTLDIVDNKWAYGLTFGWDIRPNRLQSWILRTNLRWFPDLQLAVADGQTVSFNTIEFNFIQMIIYPGRMFPRKKK